MLTRTRRLACAAVGAMALAAAPTAAAAPIAPPNFTVSPFATPPSGVKGPDDIAGLGSKYVVVAWQNGIGPKGEPSPTGATESDVILYARDGSTLRDWKVTGKVDGLAAGRGEIVATVNEDGNSSMYVINALLAGSQPVHYTYSPQPDSGNSGGVLTGGGTDGVQILPGGHLLIAASAPNNGKEETVPTATATFYATLNRSTHVATLAPTFANNAQATNALTGKTVTLGVPGSNPQALTDPDSNALVPASSPLYARQYMLNSEGDEQLVFAPLSEEGLGTPLTEVPLSREGSSAGVGDVAWATRSVETLYLVDRGTNTIYAVTGKFTPGQSYAGLSAIGSVENATEVDTLDLATGGLSPFITGISSVKGLLFLPGR